MLRSALALAVGAIGLVSVAASFANVAVRADSRLAHAVAPWDGAITAAYAADAFAAQPLASQTSLPARLAGQALSQDPTAVKAINVLAFQAQLRGNGTAADRAFAYAARLSRRELGPQIWAIEDAVNRGDIDAALDHYDIALRTQADAQPMLFPTLAAALAERRIADRLARILRAGPVWGSEFVDYAATNGKEPEGGLSLFKALRTGGVAISNDQMAGIVNGLIAAGKVDLAWTTYAQMRPGADRRISRDANFALNADVRTAFDWRASDDPGLSAAILRTARAGMIDFSLPPGAGGIVVRQVQLLPPGHYRLEGHSMSVKQPDQSRPYWSLTCQDGRELGRVVMPNSDLNGGRFIGEFSVPQGCALQTLALVVRPSDEVSGVSGQVDHARLFAAR
jgi:hypothetical protein